MKTDAAICMAFEKQAQDPETEIEAKSAIPDGLCVKIIKDVRSRAGNLSI